MQPLLQFIDPYLIMFYRLTGQVGVDFVLGTFVLSFICLVLGEFTIFLVFLITRRRIDAKTTEAENYQNLSMDALKAGNKEAYLAANKLANEAFGHTFFQQMALSAAFLWPVCFALGWMQLPLPGGGVPHPRHRLVHGLHRALHHHLRSRLLPVQAAEKRAGAFRPDTGPGGRTITPESGRTRPLHPATPDVNIRKEMT
jgi:hypothetical protein